jgi:hypothetical protein
MYHRYGRHGPHAWKHWREKRFSRHISVVDHVERETVIRLQLPFVHAERIIIIVMNMDDNGRELAEVVEATQMNQLPDKNHSLFAALRSNAEFYAEKKAKEDIKRLEDIPPFEDVQESAEESASNYIQSHNIINEVIALGGNWREIQNTYIQVFLESYNAYIQGKGKHAPDPTTWVIRKKAHADKASDSENRAPLTEMELLYQSVIRVHSHLRSVPQAPGYLQAIGKYVDVYQFEYEKYDPTRAKEEHRPNGSSQFPGHSNRPTY